MRRSPIICKSMRARGLKLFSNVVNAFEKARQQVGTLGIGALLAAAGGFLDGFTYVGHGHVFANAMTGNVVLLGISCFSGSWRTALQLLPPILAFVVGVSVSEALQ